MKYFLGLFFSSAFSVFACANVSATESLILVESKFSVFETANKLESIIKNKGLTLFGRINHSNNASKVNLELRPTELIIFGNPKVGTPIMICAQTVAIDLPQKILVWQDEQDRVWLSYNNPMYLKERHHIKNCDAVLTKLSKVLGTLSKAATSNNALM